MTTDTDGAGNPGAHPLPDVILRHALPNEKGQRWVGLRVAGGDARGDILPGDDLIADLSRPGLTGPGLYLFFLRWDTDSTTTLFGRVDPLIKRGTLRRRILLPEFYMRLDGAEYGVTWWAARVQYRVRPMPWSIHDADYAAEVGREEGRGHA